MSSEVHRDGSAGRPTPVAWRLVTGGVGERMAGVPAQQALLDQKFQEGKQHGRSEALAVARMEADAKLQPVLERLAGSIAALDRAREEIREQVAAEVARLAVAIAARILHREISVDPDAILGLVIAGFNKLQGRECSRIFVHPEHEQVLRRWLAQLATRNSIEIVGDAAMQAGEVRFETAQGQLDASIPTQLREIERGLADHIEI